MAAWDRDDTVGPCSRCGQVLHWIYHREHEGQQELRSNESGVYCRPDRQLGDPFLKSDPPHRLFEPEMFKDPQAVEDWLDA